LSQDFFKLSYSPELNGLRGVAILAVMIFHSGAPFLKGGFLGVEVFFVLSGFLITSLLVLEYDRHGSVSLKNFYIRRVLRLGPALIVLLFVVCLGTYLFRSQQRFHSAYIDSLIALFYLSNWARAFSIHPPYYLGHTWSLSIEEQFYILWPLILLILLRLLKNRYQVVIVAAALAAVSWLARIHLLSNHATPERLYNGLDVRADGLLLGCTLALALSSGLLTRPNHREKLSLFLMVMAPASAAGLAAFSTLGNSQSPWMFRFGFLIIELLAVILILDVLINTNSLVKKLLRMKWLVWIGTISYGLYLWHYPIFCAMVELRFSGQKVLIFGSLASFLVASLSYYVMEKPVLRLKKHFAGATPENRFQPASATRSGAS
jgi:peptidoglycan/LPS O-acetylase OafA/YrhL